MNKKKISIIMLVMLVLCTIPVKVVQAGGKKATVYVITSIKDPNGGGSTFGKQIFTYDSNGLVKTIKRKWSPDSKKYAAIEKYEYNGKKIIKEKVTGSDGKYSYDYNYDSNGNLIEMKGTDYGHKFEYDTHNRLIKNTNYNKDDSSTTSYSYNSKGKFNKFEIADDDGNIRMEGKIKNNSKGEISSISYLKHKLKYKYSYDKNGNIVKRKSNRFLAYSFGYNQKLTYKKISVPKSYVSVIKKQQKALIHSNRYISPMIMDPSISW